MLDLFLWALDHNKLVLELISLIRGYLTDQISDGVTDQSRSGPRTGLLVAWVRIEKGGVLCSMFCCNSPELHCISETSQTHRRIAGEELRRNSCSCIFLCSGLLSVTADQREIEEEKSQRFGLGFIFGRAPPRRERHRRSLRHRYASPMKKRRLRCCRGRRRRPKEGKLSSVFCCWTKPLKKKNPSSFGFNLRSGPV